MKGRWAVVVLALISLVHDSQAANATTDPLVQDLLAAQQRSKDGVIKFSPTSFSKFIIGKQRPFTLFMFLTARHLMDNPGMQLGPMRKDFGYVAKHLKDRIAKGDYENPGTIFFAEAEFQESQELFQRLGAQMLPFAFVLQPTTAVDQEKIRIKEADKLKPESGGSFPWTATEFDAFLVERTGISLGKVVRPSFFTSPIFPFVALASLALAAASGYKIYYLPIMKNMLIWTVGSLVVYWFSVSGGMHNIIRGMPLYALTQEGAQFFMPPGQGQLGAEGFFCGTGYLMVGLAVTGITYMHKFTGGMDVKRQRYIAYAIMLLGAWSFAKVVGVYRWKTGYRWRTYFF